MLYHFKKGKNTTETQKKTCAVCGEGAVTERMCRKWFAKFRAGDFSLGDTPWSGRPVEVDSDQIPTFTENCQCYTTPEMAGILKIPKSIELLVKMKNLFTEETTLFRQPSGFPGRSTHCSVTLILKSRPLLRLLDPTHGPTPPFPLQAALLVSGREGQSR